MPNFFVALLLMQIFSIHWKLLPVISGGNTDKRSASNADTAMHVSKYMRQVRAAVWKN